MDECDELGSHIIGNATVAGGSPNMIFGGIFVRLIG